MKVVVLGGSGLQGRAAIQDLANQEEVKEVVCADVDFSGLDSIQKHLNMKKITKERIDATSKERLVKLFSDDVDVVIDLLPVKFNDLAARAAIEAKVPLANCSYSNALSNETFEKAAEQNVAIMPESGLDPGIDLVLCGYAVSQLDEVQELYSYCGGIPEPEAADNPLKYKISWNFHTVLETYKRPAVIMRNGEVIHIDPKDQHNEEWITDITVGEYDDLETIPNGDAVNFVNILGIEKEVQNTERKMIRYAGHAEFWRKMSGLGFLETKAVPGTNGISPHEFLVKHLEPRLQYKRDEKDLTLMKNIIRGKKDGKEVEYVFELIDERDLETGLFAMNRTVGYTASIVAQMLANRTIQKTGVLSPTIDIPHQAFIDEIRRRGIQINELVNVR